MNYCSIKDAWGSEFNNNNTLFSYNEKNEINHINEITDIKKPIEKKKVENVNIMKGGMVNNVIDVYIISGLILLFIIDTFAQLGKHIY